MIGVNFTVHGRDLSPDFVRWLALGEVTPFDFAVTTDREGFPETMRLVADRVEGNTYRKEQN